MPHALLVFLGAGFGALLRWQVGLLTRALFPAFPPGTTIVNIAGCLLIGLAAGWFSLRPDAPQELRLFVITGFLGGFTTFSAFSLEIVTLWAQRPLAACGAALATVAVCLAATFAGMEVVRRIAGDA